MKGPPIPEEAPERDQAPLTGRSAAELMPRRRAQGVVPWVIAVLIALSVIAAAGGLSLDNLADNARADLSDAATVQVLEADRDVRLAERDAVVELLKRDPAVRSLRVVPEEELEALLAPWLGASEAVPIPALIDVQLAGAATDAEIARLRALVAARAPSARVDAQSGWLQPVYGALSSLQYLAIGLIMLLAITSIAAVWLASRSAFGTHRDTVEIVHHLGGTDGQIARLFQRSVAADAVVGSLAGTVFGLVIIWLVARQFTALDSGMVAGGGLGIGDWLVIAAIPLCGIALAMFTARLTVLSALRRMA